MTPSSPLSFAGLSSPDAALRYGSGAPVPGYGPWFSHHSICVSNANDAVLSSYVHAADGDSRQRALEELLTEIAMPVARSVILRRSGRFGRSRRFASEDEEDILATVMYRLLRRLASDVTADPIENFEDYVAMTAHHACDDHLRQHHPVRFRLGQAVHRALRNDGRFAIWKADGRTVCGPRDALGRDPISADADELLAALPAVQAVAKILQHLFAAAGAPLLLADVTAIVAAHFDAMRVPAAPPADRAGRESPWLKIHLRQSAEAAWQEIAALPREQRLALLLNARDSNGQSVLHFFAQSQVATQSDIARALEMSRSALAELWPHLPLQDAAIAETLGMRRQQVVNLRLTARRRLMRRAKHRGLL